MAKRKSLLEIGAKERQQIKDDAREMFLDVDSDGKKIYSYRQISDILQDRYNVEVGHVVIYQWATRYGWKDLKERVLQNGNKQAAQVVSEIITTTDEERENLIEDVKRIKNSLIDEDEFNSKILQIKKAVYMHQAYAVKRAKEHLETLPSNSGKIPNAVRAFSEANRTLFDMVSTVNFGDNQKIKLNIQVVNAEKVQINGD